MNAAVATRPLEILLDGLAGSVHAPHVAERSVPKSVTGIELDSRKVMPGNLFLAMQGSGQHGLDYAANAIARGATVIAWEPGFGIAEPKLPVPAIAVPNLGKLAGEIAARFWNHPSADLFTVGITGTDGKTSTAHLITQALDRLGEPSAYFGTLGYGRLGALQEASHTTPDPLRLQALLAEQRDAGSAAAVFEVSSHAIDQQRIAGLDLDVALLTNVGRDHLDYHGTLERYAAAKERLFLHPGLGTAIFNRDDVRGMQWSADLLDRPGLTPRLLLYGLNGGTPSKSDYVLGEHLQLHAGGLSLQLRTSWGDSQIECRLLGRFNAYNLLATLAVLLEHGVDLDDAVRALSASETVPGRVEGFRGEPGQPLVVVDYAHTPQALTQVLTALRAHTTGRLFCVFGCGGDRDRGKRPLMGAAAENGADVVIVTDDNPRTEVPKAIVEEIFLGIAAPGGVRVIHDRATAIQTAVREARAQDVVLIAGKGHEDYQIYGRETRPFSDRAYVAQLLGLEPRA